MELLLHQNMIFFWLKYLLKSNGFEVRPCLFDKINFSSDDLKSSAEYI